MESNTPMPGEEINIKDCVPKNIASDNNIVRFCEVCQQLEILCNLKFSFWEEQGTKPHRDKNGFETSGSLMRPIYSFDAESLRKSVTDTGVCGTCINKGEYVFKALRHRLLQAFIKRLNAYMKTRPMLYKQLGS